MLFCMKFQTGEIISLSEPQRYSDKKVYTTCIKLHIVTDIL